MDPTVAQWRFKEGDQVVSADDHKLGKVVAFFPDMITPTHLVVSKGMLVKHDYRIPIDAVSNYENGTIYITLTKDAALGAEAATTDSGLAEPASTEDRAW